MIETVSLEPCDNILERCSKNQDSPYGELALKPYAKSLCDQALRRRVTLHLKSGRGAKRRTRGNRLGFSFWLPLLDLNQ